VASTASSSRQQSASPPGEATLSPELFAKIRGMTPCWWLPQNALIFAPAP